VEATLLLELLIQREKKKPLKKGSEERAGG